MNVIDDDVTNTDHGCVTGRCARVRHMLPCSASGQLTTGLLVCARTSRCPPMCYAVETAIAARVPLTSAYSLPFKVTKGAPHRWTFVLVALYSAAAIDGKSSIAPACGVRAGGGGSCGWGGGVRKGSFNGGGNVESCAHFANELPHCPPAAKSHCIETRTQLSTGMRC